MATVEIADVYNPLPSTKERQVYHKIWACTLVPNIRYRLEVPEEAAEIDAAVTALQDSILEVLNNPYKFESTLVVNKRVADNNRQFDSSLSHFVVERGPERGIIHAHGVIKIKSPIKNLMLSYRLFPAAILTELKQRCSQAGIRVPTNLYSDFDPKDGLAQELNNEAAIMNYIRKNMKEEEMQTDHFTFLGDKKVRAPRAKRDVHTELFGAPAPATSPPVNEIQNRYAKYVETKQPRLEYPYDDMDIEEPGEPDDFDPYAAVEVQPDDIRVLGARPIQSKAIESKPVLQQTTSKPAVQFIQLQVPKF